ncbi:MAG: hypothetical protein WD595_03285 [Waddliaceae bacterium]
MSKERSYFTFIIIAALFLIIWTFIPGNTQNDQSNQSEEIARASLLLSQNHTESALDIIEKQSGSIDPQSITGRKWFHLTVIAKEKQKDIEGLVALYEQYPQQFSQLENPALLVAKHYLIAGSSSQYHTLRNHWKGKEIQKPAWTLLDADLLMYKGKTKEAKELLDKTAMTGDLNLEKQIRLAHLNQDQPKKAWDHLSKALKQNSTDPKTRLWRAALLESAGKIQMAQTEYLAAVDLDTYNPYLQDQLAKFYVRQRQFDQAIDVWQEAIAKENLPFLWDQLLFWEHVAEPTTIKVEKIPEGELSDYHRYLASLPEGLYWDQGAFEQIKGYAMIQEEESSVFWLQILDALQREEAEKAWNLLLFNPFPTQSLDPDLQLGMLRILQYQIEGNFDLPAHYPQDLNISYNRHPLFLQLEQKNASDDLQLRALLESKIAYSAALLASGWKKAAYALFSKREKLQENYPSWVAPEFTALIEEVEGTESAVQYAENQPPHPELAIYLSEYYLSRGDKERALSHLLLASRFETPTGLNAAKKAAALLMKENKHEKVKTVIEENPSFVSDPEAVALLARSALAEDNTDLAVSLYRMIQDRSSEAKSYLAKKAYLDKDFETAIALTEELIRENPENGVLKSNLNRIKKAASKD